MATKPTLKQQQDKWYKKLARSGFKDIEDTAPGKDRLKTWAVNFKAKYTPDQFQAKADYWQMCRDMVHSYAFKNKREKRIWELYAEGKSVRDIEKELKYAKSAVARTIRRLRRNLSERLP